MPKTKAKETEQLITEFVWVKKEFTPEQKIELGEKMADADERLSGKEAELDSATEAFKDRRKTLESEMTTISQELHEHARKFRQGYEEIHVECTVKYEGNRKLSYAKDTGALVEDREMTEAEQMRLSGNMVDAEAVIREARKED